MRSQDRPADLLDNFLSRSTTRLCRSRHRYLADPRITAFVEVSTLVGLF